MEGKIYEFEDYVLDVAEQRLQKDGEDISLPPKVFEVLIALVKKHSQLVSYDELMEEVWQDTFVEETNLRYCIHSLRKVFDKQFIETVPKRGYRFNAEVRSYTAEEFIKKYAGGGKSSNEDEISPETPSKPPAKEDDDFEPSKSNSFFTKPLGFITISILMAIIGFSAYYFWQAESKPTEKDYLTTIAVVPFSIIGEQNDEIKAFRDGLNNEIVFNLSKMKDVKVLPEDDISFDKNNGTISSTNPAIERVLTGSYKIEDGKIRVNYKFVLLEDEKNVLNKTITHKATNLLELENVIALQIIREINHNLYSVRQESEFKDLNISEETKNLYLTSQRIPNENDLNRWNESAELLKKVVANEPEWAYARAKLAEATLLANEKENCSEAKKIALETLSMNETMSIAHYVLGYCAQLNYEWDDAENSFKQAIKYNPLHTRTYIEYGLLLDMQNRFAEADMIYRKLLEISPFASFYNTIVCQHYYFDKKLKKAENLCRNALKIEPDYWMAKYSLAWIYLYKGQTDKLLELEFDDLSESEKADDPLYKVLSKNDLKTYVKLRANNEKLKMSSINRASLFAILKNRDKTIEYLRKGIENKDLDFYRVPSDPIFDFVENDEEYIKLLKKMNLTP